MKILYAIQGTGNGHLSRAADIVPCLQKHGEVDLLVSGIQGDLTLPFAVKYQLRGLSFIFGKRGGVDLWKTFVKTNPKKLIKDINRLPVEDYDLVINDFEPVSAWACYLKNKTCIGLSHQAAVLSADYAQPDQDDRMGRLILQNYAPVTTQYGFHFRGNRDNIYTPVIRNEIRNLQITSEGHYTVYLPAYDDERLIASLSAFPEIKWEVFSKHNFKAVQKGNIQIQPIDSSKFTASLASCTGVLCGAGFETPAEALYLGKKLLVVPMKNQYEQQLNGAALKEMGVPVLKSLKEKHNKLIRNWLENTQPLHVDYRDMTQEIIDRIVLRHAPEIIP